MLDNRHERVVISLARFLACLNGEPQPCEFVTGREPVLLRVLPWPLCDFVAWLANEPGSQAGMHA